MTEKKVWFITGAGRGMGVDIAKASLAAGNAVVATGRNTDAVARAVGEADDLLVVRLDVTNPADAQAAVQAAVERFGRIDVLVNNAGNFFAGYFEELSPEQIRWQIETNLFGPMNITRAVLPVMRQQRSGLVVAMSSTAGLVGQEFTSAYAASKFGIEGWIESLTPEIAPFGIRTMLVEPGFFRTELLEEASTTYAEPSIDDYAARTQETVTAWRGMNGQQSGDPAKLAAALVRLAGQDQPPLRWIAGADAVDMVEQMEPTEPPRRMGHEFIGIVEAVGADVRTMNVGDFVIAPFLYSDGTCVFCREGLQSSCLHGGRWGWEGDGGQGEAVRVPEADGTLVALPAGVDDALMPSLLALTDVMTTGHHAAVSARVSPGKTAAVVGDGAVGLCGVIAAKRLGAERIILLGRIPDRIALGREFGATDIVSERGDEAVERVRELTGGFGVHSVLECVGLEQSTRTALHIARPGGAVGRVGIPQQDSVPEAVATFFKNVTIGGGPAPVRAYIEELLPDVLDGKIQPGRVFDRVTTLDGVPDGYRAMNERDAIKVLVKL